MTFSETAVAYEQAPDQATLAALRADILGVNTYRPDADPAAATSAARNAGRHADVVATIMRMMPGCHLSPSAHGLLAESYAALGDVAAADRERALAKLALRSILSTGDGTEDEPWSVLMVSDEYDLLLVLGRRSTGQELIRRSGRRFDRHTHADGTESWFDVTAMPERRARAS